MEKKLLWLIIVSRALVMISLAGHMTIMLTITMLIMTLLLTIGLLCY